MDSEGFPETKAANRSDTAPAGDRDEPEGSDPFDWTLYSALIRKDRKDRGYRTAASFSETIYRRTRVSISRDTIYKIEQGKQTPDALQFMAINISLYKTPLPKRVTDLCFSPEWRSIVTSPEADIPIEWKYDNFAEAAGENANDPKLDPRTVSFWAGDDPRLFENPWMDTISCE